jgi:predicted O-methyltransferase YrrM
LLPSIEVPSTVGKLLYTLAKIHKPKRILEIGTLAGYSTIWLARALPPEGELLTIEFDQMHARVARENIENAGFSSQVTVIEGVASLILERMVGEKEEPFDLIFIDADKENYPLYLKFVLELSHPGSLILSDNLIPKETEIGSPDPSDIQACGIYKYNQEISTHPRLESILVTTIVGEKGRVDALGVSLVK